MLSGDLLDLEASVDLPARAGNRAENPERRDLRRGPEIADLGTDSVGDDLRAPIYAERFAQPRIRLRFEAVISRLALAVFVDRKSAFGVGPVGGRLIDEVAETAVIKAALEVQGPRGAMDAELDARAALRVEVGIADQELLAAAMRAELE